ncbi:MAG: alpha/beta fold hydrolase [Dermatophilaceae bacterium]
MFQDTTAATQFRTRHRTARVGDLDIFYREAGPPGAPILVLLPGFPAASHQYRRLIDALSHRYHLIAPDYPGFGHSTSPTSNTAGGTFAYTFDHLADVTEAFLRQLGLDRFFLYVFDFGAPIGFRIASRNPDWIAGVIAQNGNAYDEGLGPQMQLQAKYWADRDGMEDTIRGLLTLDVTQAQHQTGAADPELVDPDGWLLDQHWLDTPGRAQVMLDLLHDYQSNTALYPTWQAWLRDHQPPLLLTWGRNDDFFPEAGAHAYLKDVPGAELHLLDGGHFALDEHLHTIAPLIDDFITRNTSPGRQTTP